MTSNVQKIHPDTYGILVAHEVSESDILGACKELYDKGMPLKTIVAFDEREQSGFFKIMYLFSDQEGHVFRAPYMHTQEKFPSLTPLIHQASIHERKIASFFGLKPIGHPNLRPLILHEQWPESLYPLRKEFVWKSRPDPVSGSFPFRHVHGEGIYEIPVGPVHAGIIEPGHFRFSVAGEEILHLEPRLGYSHKGIEKLFEILPLDQKIRLSERVSGDSSFSHSLAFCQTFEQLGSVLPSRRVQFIRVIYCELERIANHFGDIGAIMLDTGYNFGGSHGARLREVVMRLNEALSGSRFLRGINSIGGVTRDISNSLVAEAQHVVTSLRKDFSEVMALALQNSSLIERLKGTGILDYRIAKDHGIVGVAAKALGFAYDARKDHPYAAYDAFSVPIPSYHTGDVYARFRVRVDEVYASLDILEKALSHIPAGPICADILTHSLAPSTYAVGIVEGWRGDIVYVVSTDANGLISRVDVRDPSFLNWTVLGHAGKGNMVPDFPLINKSFNLSYSGNDL